MDYDKDLAQTAIEQAFKTKVGALYENLVSTFITEGDDSDVVKTAMDRFREGLNLSQLALAKAREIISK
jgi:hypothetical protein